MGGRIAAVVEEPEGDILSIKRRVAKGSEREYL